MDGSGYPNGL
ncbi:TPA: hypothetical protein JBD69_14885 [Legionella pneumophila subsp. pneumophila]|nr:hypothetical protein [Legionella pneumophila]HAT8683885.1 hypothetical protein [Legionella pneumophila subsp. pneumophila ATCC 43283]HAT8883555.1 hypothetical protein [Legionella pneumophila subsp. pneumophila]HAT7800193.1 hypothetical protein [Legionella pneumophila]HAT8743400.1 hypothetical protein [Legionella pneumophila]